MLVLYAETQMVDEYGRLAVTLTGENEGVFICGGKSGDITWSREDHNSQFRYTKADGSPLAFGVGKTYICIVPVGSKLEMS